MRLWDALRSRNAPPVASPKTKASPPPPEPPTADDDDPEEETQDDRDDRRRFLVAWFKRLRADMDHRVEQLTEQLADGKIDSQAWAAAFRTELTKAHVEARSIGRRLAGYVGPFEDDDLSGGQAAWAAQEAFFEGFLADVEAGRYTKDEALLEAQVNARSKQYVAALRGTTNASFREALGQDLLTWILGAGDHCKPSKGFPYDCPSLAEEPAKPADEWDTEPGGGKTSCRNFCTCHWLAENDGKSYSTEGL